MRCGCLALILFFGLLVEDVRSQTTKVAREIITAATAEVGEERPLPLAGHWHTGTTVPAYGPPYQFRLLNEGRHIIPWFVMPEPDNMKIDPAYYEAAVKRAYQFRLPIALVGTQWERLLSSEDRYYRLPADENPNVVVADGAVRRQVSPFGPVEPWRDVGRRWVRTPMLQQIQKWYPDPPMVLFVSNNEHAKLRWTEIESDRRWPPDGQKQSDGEKQEAVARGWQDRYGALLAEMRAGLSPGWQKAARFIGYSAFLPGFVGRWDGWVKHSLTVPGKLSVWPIIWQGASMPYYTQPWDGSSDYQLWSPQVEAMNWATALEPRFTADDFWFELSTWDGNEGKPDDKRLNYEKAGQSYGPERYAGYVRYGLWLTRPRSVREFRPHTSRREETADYFNAVLDAVDEVHRNETLSLFWRKGTLVPNRSVEHPYQTLVPTEWVGVDRWYRLDCNQDPPKPWTLHTPMNLFSLAIVLGEPASRRWLVYAHAPTGRRSQVTMRIPEGPTLTVDVSVEGGFWTVEEASGETTPLRP